jgi:hypothetical protein
MLAELEIAVKKSVAMNSSTYNCLVNEELCVILKLLKPCLCHYFAVTDACFPLSVRRTEFNI